MGKVKIAVKRWNGTPPPEQPQRAMSQPSYTFSQNPPKLVAFRCWTRPRPTRLEISQLKSHGLAARELGARGLRSDTCYPPSLGGRAAPTDGGWLASSIGVLARVVATEKFTERRLLPSAGHVAATSRRARHVAH